MTDGSCPVWLTLSGPTAVVTFDQHPAKVVRPESAPRVLTDLEQKLELLADAGVDYTIVIHFDAERSHESADDFVREVLAGCLHARVVVVGEDFHFGRNRGGNVELLLPYATIEPIRSVLLQMFMGEKFGRDPVWEGHFATEVAQAQISVDAVLYEAEIPLKQLMMLKVGDTLPLEMRADALVAVRCGSVTLTEGRMGRVGDRVAIRVSKQLRKPNTTFAMFERADEQTKLMEAQ